MKLYKVCKELCGCIMSESYIVKDFIGRDCCPICMTPLDDTEPVPKDKLPLLTWDEVKNFNVDVTLIVGDPTRYMYFNSYNVYYPIEV